MKPETIYCQGVQTVAVYWTALGGWYCARCGAAVRVVITV